MAKIQLTTKEIKTIKKLAKPLEDAARSIGNDRPMQSTQNGLEREEPVKSWSELNVEEKIERMRKEVKNRTQDFNSRLNRLTNDIHWIKRHVHDKDGKAVLIQGLTEYYDREVGSLYSEAQKSAGSNGTLDYF